MQTYSIHPKCADVREMTADEYDRLITSIARHGYDPAYPIVVHEGMILDGRHRYKACRELNIEPVVIEWAPTGDDTPELVVLRSLARRHMTKSELAALAVEALPAQERLAQERMKAGKADPTAKVRQGTAAKVVAEAAGVSERLVQDAKKLKEDAPEEFEAVKKGEKSIGEAKEAAKPVPPRPKQMTDGAGRAITDPDVLYAMTQVSFFSDMVNKLHAIKREILRHAEDPSGARIRVNTIETDFKNIVAAVKFATPFAQCPYRSCKTRGCDACKGTRWVTEEVWNNIPKNIREAVK
jgi:hypothetical protein